MVMPITSTKNFRLSSGFGVSRSRWPRWAISKIGSGVMAKSFSVQHTRQVVEQFVDAKGARNEALLGSIVDDQLQRGPERFDAEWERIRIGLADSLLRLLQQSKHFAHRLRVGSGQCAADDDEVIDRHRAMLGEPA